MAIETGLEGKPWYVQLIVALVLAALLVWGVHYFFITKLNTQIARQETKLAELQNKINEGRAAQRSLPQFREEVRRLELELEKLLRILPARRNTEEILRRVRALVEQGDFALLRVTPGSFVPNDFYFEWPIRIQLEGTYHNLALFFDRISRFARIMNIEDLQIQALRTDSRHTIGANFNAKTFIYNEPTDEDAGP